ncbi:MAG: hypothetical protein Q7R69_00175 [bacterium]|nr:hypothetical protein [bacterium]
MNQFKQILREHRVAIALAVLTSVIAASPQVYFRLEHRNDGIYQGIELLPDSPWSARAREVQDGHPNFGNIYQKDGKDNPYLLQPLGSMVVAYMGEIFSLDINNTFLLSRFVLSFIVFLLIYGFVFLLSKDKLVALCGAAVNLLADSILSKSGLVQLFFHGVSYENFLRLSKPVNPAMIYFFLFAFLIAFWLFYRKRKWQYGVISAILLGLNFYNYFYTWTYLYSFGGVLVLLLLIQKKWREAVRISSVFLGAFLVATPYVINLYRVTQFPAYNEVSSNIGVLLTHAPLFVGWGVIVALIIFFLGFPKGDREKYFFGLALLLTPFVTLNQQLFTGKVLEAPHYHWFFHKPMAIIFMLIVIFYLLARWKLDFYKKALAVLIIVTSVTTGIYVQAYSYSHDMGDGGTVLIGRQRYGPVMKWLNLNAEKESVVFANDEISHITVIYTPLNVFYHRSTSFASLSATYARQLNTMFSFYRLAGVDSKEVEDAFLKDREKVSFEAYGIHYRELFGSHEAFPDEKIREIALSYKKTLSLPAAEWLKNLWTKYEVAYLVWDKKSDPLWNLDKYKFLTKVAEFDDIAIYRKI